MKGFIAKALVTVAFMISILGCGNTAKVRQNQNVISGFLYGYEQIINNHQLDSICTVDAIPRDLSQWISNSYRDFETGTTVTKSMYIKELDANKETIYILIPKDKETYKITKRIGNSR